jgi:nucleoside-diphosphate-sugar epimerase
MNQHMPVLPVDAVVLLTGATGFIGSHCLSRLLRERCVVHAVSLRPRNRTHDRVTWHAEDLRLPEAARQLINRVRPTHLLNTAWIAAPGRFWSDPENLDWLQSGLAVLRGFGEAGGVRFVGVGTCAEYDPKESLCAEDETPICPETLYGKAKAAMAAAVEAFSANYRFSAAWGRIFQPYGPGEAPQRLIPSVIETLLAGRPVDLSEGKQERDFIYAADVADLLVRLLVGGEEGAFNVGTGRGTQVRSVAERIADRLGGRELLRFGTIASDAEPERLVADMSKVALRLGWSAPTSLEAGLKRILNCTIKKQAERRARKTLCLPYWVPFIAMHT